jgi:subtilisin family serine protease/predicted nucleic acid-binding Zn ribbon protein
MELKGLAWPMRVGKVDIESLSVINAIRWHEYNFTGKGLKVGILDIGFDKYKNLLGTDLPQTVTARSFTYGKEIDAIGTQHGTSCAEVIHDIAPDAELVFTTFETDAEAYQAMDWLISQGVNIISNSTGGEVGPLDGTSDFDKRVDRIVDNGVLWVNSAGNTATSHYRGTFTDEDGDGYHEFAPGDEFLGFMIPTGLRGVVLNWDDWKNGNQDFDLYIYDENDNLIASSENTQNGPGSESVEEVVYDFPDNGPYYAAFYAAHATRRVVFDFLLHDGNLEYEVPEYSITSPGDAIRSFTVGAVNWDNDVLEEYSSRGPTPDGRLKPEISAPTNVTSVAKGDLFSGTSAACPHVAGAAALVWQANPDFTNQKVIEFLESRAVDLGSDGPDNSYGYGRLWLGDPPGAISLPTPTKESAFVPPEETVTPSELYTATPSTSDGESKTRASLGIFICVVAPGFIGLGGICLLGLVLLKRRSRPEMYTSNRYSYTPPAYPRTPPASPGKRPVHLPETPQESRIGAKAEERYLCPRCGISHRPQARFCPVCGFALKPDEQAAKPDAYCIYCGKALLPNSKFCSRCGKPR